MEKTVLFRDYQKAQTDDFNNMQTYTRQSFDDIVGDVVTGSMRYAGFNVVKSNTAEITVAAGRFYGPNANNMIGAVFSLSTQTIINLVQYLAVSQVTQRILTLCVYGVENSINVQTRDFLTNTQTLQTQPQAVAMTDSRDAVLAVVAGAESGTPQAPAIGVAQVAIANILVDANGVISVTMLPTAKVHSTEDLDSRVTVIETFDSQVGPRITSLASDLAALANKFATLNKVSGTIIDELAQDVANLKDLNGLPSAYAQYGALHYAFPDVTKYDTGNIQALGYLAMVYYGCRFPAQNAALFALSLFNTLDPNAAYNTSSGLLLPSYTNRVILQNSNITSSTSMSQYGYQTYALVQKNMSYSRVVAGPSYTVCTNGAMIQTSVGDSGNEGWWLPNWSSYATVSTTGLGGGGHYWYQQQYYWHESWTQPYWVLDTINHSVNGAQVAQSFLISSDVWLTQIGIYISALASATDVWITLCQCTGGQPDLSKTLSHAVMAGSGLKVGWNVVTVPPVFCAKGDRMAVVVTTAANHQIGLAPAGSYLDGTFFYTLDGTYYLGDFTKEMALLVYGAQFSSNQVTIEFGALNLAGGIRNIDLAARQVVPNSCNLIFEVLPAGTGTWLPITPDSPLVPFQSAPVLCRFRARFIGTPSIMPGIMLNDSICSIWTPGPTFVLVTQPETLAVASGSINVKLVVENFNPVAHSLASTQGDTNGWIKIYKGSPLTAVNPTTVTTKLVDAGAGRYEITAAFTGISPTISTFVLAAKGTTNSVSNTFHIATTTWWAL